MSVDTSQFIQKYKPAFIKDFCFEQNFQTMLDALFRIDNLNIIFIGPPSCGKTSLLYSIMREYYGQTDFATYETNVMMINNLKEQGIHYYRNEMKLFCRSKCSIRGRKKMVIVDDLDFMQEQSQQVFRNYIDNYKTNVHFLFACTNLYKVIESLQSRVQIMQIPSITNDAMRNILTSIVQKENVQLNPPAVDYLIRISSGYVRPMIQCLEKLVIYNGVKDNIEYDRDLVVKICSTISDDIFEEYFQHILAKDINTALIRMNEVIERGYSVIDIIEYMYDFVKRTDMLSDNYKYTCIRNISEFKKTIKESMEDKIEMLILIGQIMAA
jgi:replication factor C subunit 3/5